MTGRDDRRADVVVVGGGAVGAWCTLALARAGRSVLLLEERAALATRATFGNAGLVTVSSAAPLAAPGIMRKALGWSLRPHGVARIRPAASRRWAAWALHFRAACSRERADATARVSLGLVHRSLALLDELAAESALDFSYRRAGLVAGCVGERALDAAWAGIAHHRELGVRAEPLDAAGVRERVPWVGPGVRGGTFYPDDAALDPAAMARAACELARAHGAAVELGAHVGRIVRDGPRGIALETSLGRVRAQDVVLATGSASGALLAPLGIVALIEAGKGYSDDLALAAPLQGPPLRLVEARMVATPLGDRLRVTSKLDLGHADESVDQRRADGALRQAAPYLSRDVLGARVRAPWTGVRPLTPDGLPLVGRHPALPALVLATGHGHLGVTHGPATGALVAQLLSGDEAPPELERLRVDRFDGALLPARRRSGR